eukprot:5423978-Pyramimonas_sp.AAC.1
MVAVRRTATFPNEEKEMLEVEAEVRCRCKTAAKNNMKRDNTAKKQPEVSEPRGLGGCIVRRSEQA